MAEQELEILQGTIAAVVYQNYDNGYAVLRLSCGGSHVTVVGTIPMPVVGEMLMVTGRWSSHSNFGKQFEAEFLERMLPQSALEIQRYLAGRAIKGIGPVMAARIVEHFGDETLLVLEREPEKLALVPGISLEKARAFGAEFRRQAGLRQLMEFFALHHLPTELAIRAYKLYGDQTVGLLYDDPYLLMDDGLDAPFSAVDRFAIELGVAADDPRRIEAGILFELHYNLGAGHTFLPRDKLVAATAHVLTVEPEPVLEGLGRLHEGERLVCQKLANIDIVYLPQLHEAEVFCALSLLRMARWPHPEPEDLDRLMQQVEAGSDVRYSEQQRGAIRAAATNGVLLITGGPGTG